MAEETIEEREERAKISTSSKELEKLSDDEDEDVRRVVTKNSNTSVSVLEKLAKDDYEKVRSAVAQNTNTPALLLVWVKLLYVLMGGASSNSMIKHHILPHTTSGQSLQ